MESVKLLEIENLGLGFRSGNTINKVLHGISYDLHANEILAIVGESGSGKSVSTLAILGLLPKRNTVIGSGTITFDGKDLLTSTDRELQEIRGNKISMIFQEPMSSLNPSMRCGDQVAEILLQHTKMDAREARIETLQLFEQVKLPRPEALFSVYPHEISGGQKQRVMIAMAVACKPKILIADEPTTALDVTVQQDIIQLLKSLQQAYGMSVIFISHDLDLVSGIADRVLVMYKGEIVESAFAKALFSQPQHPYTQALLHARPKMDERLEQLPTIADFMEDKPRPRSISAAERKARHEKIYAQPPLLEVRDVTKEYLSNTGLFSKKRGVVAVKDASLKVYEGETLGLVGESGSGKSTLGNVILQLDRATSGTVFYRGQDITDLKGAALRRLRRELQIIFQDPYSSLNPRLTVGQAIMEPMAVHGLFKSKRERREKALELLGRVGLEAGHFDRYPHEFSGGQRQRVGIARTIAVQPKLIICDESVSALDISVQAQVLNLLNALKEDFGFTYIFISHDLAVVKYMADQITVLKDGEIVERGEADALYANPEQSYTKQLISAIPEAKS